MQLNQGRKSSNNMSIGKSVQVIRMLLMLIVVAISVVTDPAYARSFGARSSSSSEFTICKNQTYALCALASCFVLNGVSYCRCKVEHGTSISASFDYDDGDICTINAQGRTNGYMVSTYSFPRAVQKGGPMALYTCPKKTSDGAYAQCDGAVCFRSTQGQSFPGFDKRLRWDELICSCPITVNNPSTATDNYQIAGPYPCQQDYFANCSSETANENTGSIIYSGAPAGALRFLTKQLYGWVPPLNQCVPH
jgi:hypothetical protein